MMILMVAKIRWFDLYLHPLDGAWRCSAFIRLIADKIVTHLLFTLCMYYTSIIDSCVNFVAGCDLYGITQAWTCQRITHL